MLKCKCVAHYVPEAFHKSYPYELFMHISKAMCPVPNKLLLKEEASAEKYLNTRSLTPRTHKHTHTQSSKHKCMHTYIIQMALWMASVFSSL